MESAENDASEIKPYLVRAIHEWCTDNGYTPYLSVVVDAHTRVPREYVKDGQIVLNLGLDATHQLSMGNDLITFQARFNGAVQGLSVPVGNVAAIYARENGQGMAFEPMLQESEPELVTAVTELPSPVSLATAEISTEMADSVQTPPPPSSGRPHLTRIK
ncbi:MAG: ClpXP protease specificity-enhancing factor [Sterolibacterium sp.]|jgi:stringent starvation protein B|nr:ClpXP protease specificity-enhancing factor [Sterolibacterium sp.]